MLNNVLPKLISKSFILTAVRTLVDNAKVVFWFKANATLGPIKSKPIRALKGLSDEYFSKNNFSGLSN